MEVCKTSDSGVRDWRGERERGMEGERRVREGRWKRGGPNPSPFPH